MKRPKIGIFKLYEFGTGSRRRRWLGADLVSMLESGKVEDYEIKRMKRPRLPVWDLKLMMEVKTERQLIQLVYKNWGDGTYMISGYAGGKIGAFTFWKGLVSDQGFMFLQREYEKKEVNYWKREFAGEDDEDAKELIREAKEDAKEQMKNKRYGFYPFLKSSGRRGTMILWDDEDKEDPTDGQEEWAEEIPKEDQEDWGKIENPQVEKW